MRIGDPVVPLSIERFRLLRNLINGRFGIFFNDGDRYLVESRLSERLMHLGITTFDEYFHYLTYHTDGEAELEEAAEILTTNETYFLREDYQLRSFAGELLPELKRRNAARRRLLI
ncbi:MAG TPA: protein-glutamate O-methyltransferase CheR, partial [Polyangia bacterium]|nr:protein-glutamate O-methyltransferase CheR [Polyangia bacterium]